MDQQENDKNDGIAQQYMSMDIMKSFSPHDVLVNPIDEELEQSEEHVPTTFREKLLHIYQKERLLIEVGLAMLLAYLFPVFGAVYLYPEVTAHWISVIIIFCK